MLSLPITVALIPMRTKNPKNTREHWRTVWRRTKNQRRATWATLRQVLGPVFPSGTPVLVTLTRIAPRQLDHEDNLPVALSGARDGVADYLTNAGFEQGEDRLTWVGWRYEQRRGAARQYGVEITIAPWWDKETV